MFSTQKRKEKLHRSNNCKQWERKQRAVAVQWKQRRSKTQKGRLIASAWKGTKEEEHHDHN